MSRLRAVRAAAFDFDGTLLEHDGTIAPVAVDAIRRAADAGLRIGTASGRSVGQQQEFLEAVGLGAPAGIPHGLMVDERSVWLLDGDHYAPLQPWNHSMDQLWSELMPMAVGLCEAAVAELAGHGLTTRLTIAAERVAERGQQGVRFESEALALEWRDWFVAFIEGSCPQLRVTQNWHLCQVLPRAAGKGNALVALARAWGLEPAEMLAVGDRHNDVPMLDGLLGLVPAAVGNAVEDVKALVRSADGYVAAAATGAGVAELLARVLAARAA